MKDVEIGRVEYIHVALKQEAYPSIPRLVLAAAVITMHVLLLQKQTNMSDCGAFAIAFAMAICNRQRPGLFCFDITNTECGGTCTTVWRMG